MSIAPTKIRQTVIRLQDVERNYRLGKTVVQALRGISLDISNGEFTAIAGPSGSGKTTLLNIIGCIDKPDTGQVIVHNRDVTSVPTHKLATLRNQSFGFIFQTFNLIPVLTAYENIEFPLLLRDTSAAERRQKVDELLERVGLTDHRHHRPQELSGGQRQRVAIARALVTTPLAILADEPTANLDSTTSREIIQLMAELNESKLVTFIFSTHDPEIMSQARRILMITDGRLVSDSAKPVTRQATRAQAGAGATR